MKMTLNDDAHSYSISAYAEGEFTVRGQVLQGSHIIFPNKAALPWAISHIDQLNQENFAPIISNDAEAVIICTGKNLLFPDDLWLEQFNRQSIGVEIMDTPAACRTYNILVSEGRQILAALIPV